MGWFKREALVMVLIPVVWIVFSFLLALVAPWVLGPR
jgi:hypothetical protein